MTERDLDKRVKSCYATWAGSYHKDYYESDQAYPPVHVRLVNDLIRAHGATKVLDAGCGPASMLRELPADLELYGFDLTPEMVEEGRSVMAGRVPPNRIWEGSVVDPKAFRQPDDGDGYDAAICIGVLPHIPEEDDSTVVQNLLESVRPGGLVVLEARNAFFSLYTLNRHTKEFFFDQLLPTGLLQEMASEESEELKAALQELEEMFRADLPPLRRGSSGEPGYDEILSRTHNPLNLKELCEAHGLRAARILYYHFHALPPLVGSRVPKLQRAVSLEIEDPDDWRGIFMASAFLIAGTRK